MTTSTATPCAVRMPAGHWFEQAVHSYRRWTADRVIETWCGLTADLDAGAALTTDLIRCSACAEVSLKAWRR